MTKYLIILLLSLSVGLMPVAHAQNSTISGTVTDAVTGETLIGATVVDGVSGKGAVTNAYGRYSLTLKGDSASIKYSYFGYQSVMRPIRLEGNVKIDVAMGTEKDLKAVVITAQKVNSVRSSQMSAIEMPVEQLQAVPVLFGEADVLKALQLLPGVQSGSEGQNGMYVRGGGPDENLFLLDGVPVYNVNHSGGFFSAFNSDAVKNITLYKGSFPARFGGRLSSVLDITTNNGNDKELHGNVSVGLISAKFALEGPIVKEKTTFSLSARRTYGDFVLQPIIPMLLDQSGKDVNVGYYFYDLNAKVTHKFSDKSRLYGSWYMGDDDMYAKIQMGNIVTAYMYQDDYLKFGYHWGNMVGSLRWNYVLMPKLFMNVSGSYTRYRNSVLFGTEQHYTVNDETTMFDMDMDYNSGIRDWTGRVDFDFTPDPDHNIKFGTNYIFHKFKPEVLSTQLNSGDNLGNEGYDVDTTIGGIEITAQEMMLFAEDDWSISEDVKVNMGLNLSGFKVRDVFYPSLQPRLSGRWMMGDGWSMKAGYAYMTQYLHLLSNSSVSLPTDLWVPVTDKVEPMTSNQFAAGVFYSWKNTVDFSIEGYYKKMSNLIEYREGTSLFGSTDSWEEKVCMGDGWSYGLEFLAQKSVGKWTGWLGYTWSKSERLFDREGQMLNSGKVFPAKYDRRHDVSIVCTYKPNKRFDCSVTWVYSTGNTSTLMTQNIVDPTGSSTITLDDDGNPVVTDGPLSVGYLESRNNYRLPAYHRMDIGVNFHKELRHGVRTWSISVYNLYNHKNPYLIYQTAALGLDENPKLMQLSIFPILPSVSYIFKF